MIKEGHLVNGREDTLDFMGNKKIGDRKKGGDFFILVRDELIIVMGYRVQIFEVSRGRDFLGVACSGKEVRM